MTNLIKELEQEQLKTDLPEFAVGDTVRVQVKVKEVNRERLQAFEGVVIAKKEQRAKLIVHGSQDILW